MLHQGDLEVIHFGGEISKLPIHLGSALRGCFRRASGDQSGNIAPLEAAVDINHDHVGGTAIQHC